MVNVYVCDDDTRLLAKINKTFRMLAGQNKLDVCMKEFETGPEMIREFGKDEGMVDIIYLNMNQSGESAIELGKELRNMGFKGEIIFLAENEDYVLRSFEVRPSGYIIKGKGFQTLLKNMFVETSRKIDEASKECLLCSKGGIIKRIPLKNIVYIEIRGRTSKIYYEDDTFEISVGLGELEKHLKSKNFIRINRSFLVNVIYISAKKGKSVELVTGDDLLIGESYFTAVQEKLSDYLWEMCYIGKIGK